MEGAPSCWTPIITPHLYQFLEQFQLAVKFHKDSLVRAGNDATSPIKKPYYSKEVPSKGSFNPFHTQQANMNLVGWTIAASKPQFPKDDSNVSP